MTIGDVFTVGGYAVSVGLSYIAITQQKRLQDLEGFRNVIEIMQERGMLPSVRQLDQILLDEEAKARQQQRQVAPTRQQKSLPSPQAETVYSPRRIKVPVKAVGYDPNKEAYTDDVDAETVVVQQPRRRARQYPRSYYDDEQ